MALRNAKGYYKDIKEKIRIVKEKREELDSQYKAVEQEKSEMYNKFEQAAAQLRDKTNFKNQILEQKLMVFQSEYEKKELTLRELL
jgi:hypothetical protein